MITKEQVLENIKAKLGNTQKISDRTILGTVEALLQFATEETVLDEFVEKVYPTFLQTNINYIHDTTDFVKNYKPIEKVVAQSPITAAPPTLEDIKALMASERDEMLKPLKDDIDAIKGAKEKEQIFKNVRNRLKEAAKEHYQEEEANEAWRYAIKGLGSDITEDSLYKEFKEEYEEQCSKLGRNGRIPIDSVVLTPQDSIDYSKEVARLEAEGKISVQKKEQIIN
ncbi:MAG: hypothetical protein RR513_06550 [Muribaculaceae bacterium]